MIDAWLLKRFPGRTLEELDSIDWFRFMRALEAEKIERVEEKLELMTSKKLKAKDVSAADHKALIRHDELLAEYGD